MEIDTSAKTVFGIPRRVIGFGFGLFLTLVVLAVVYSQFARDRVSLPMGVPAPVMSNDSDSLRTPGDSGMSVTGPVTPDSVSNDLIDEALSDNDIDVYTDDEMADIEDGSNY